jgi:hypothetical protein
MTRAKEFSLPRGASEFRIICPECKSVWSTMELPDECPTCTALVTVRTIRRPDSVRVTAQEPAKDTPPS